MVSAQWHAQARQVLGLPLRLFITPAQRRCKHLTDVLVPTDLLQNPILIARSSAGQAEELAHTLLSEYPVQYVVLANEADCLVYSAQDCTLISYTDLRRHLNRQLPHDPTTHARLRRWVNTGARKCSDGDYISQVFQEICQYLRVRGLDVNDALLLVARIALGLVIGKPIVGEKWLEPNSTLLELWRRSERVLPIEGPEKEHALVGLDDAAKWQIAYRLAPVEWLALAWDLFGSIYTKGMTDGSRRSKGVYFTPPSLVDLVLDIAGICDDPQDHGRILEPCAGTGAFVVRLLTRMRESACVSGKEQLALVLSRLTAIEPDPIANRLLLLNVAIQWTIGCGDVEEPMPAWRPIQGDALMAYSEMIPTRSDRVPNSIESREWDEAASSLRMHNDFAYVIGNPPYIGESGRRALFAPYRAHPFWSQFCESKMDFLQFFIVLGLTKIQACAKGRICYLTSSYWLTADGATRLRALALEHCCLQKVLYIDGDQPLFKDAPGHHSAITLFTRCADVQVRATNLVQVAQARLLSGRIAPLASHVTPQAELDGRPWFLQVKTHSAAAFAALERHPSLSIAYSANQGVVPGAQRIGPREIAMLGTEWVESHAIQDGEGVFVLSEAEVAALALPDHEKHYLRPFVKNSAIKPFGVRATEPLWLIYLRHDVVRGNECPRLIRHLSRFKPLLQRKREYRTGQRDWFHMHWPREENLFEGEKIMTGGRSSRPAFAWAPDPLYAATDVYYIRACGQSQLVWPSLLALTAILNSGLAWFWFYHRTKSKGAQREFFSNALLQFPLPKLPASGCIDEWSAANAELAKCAHALYVQRREEDVVDNPLLTRIDNAVFRLYSLPPEAEQQVRTWLKERKKPCP